MIVRFTTILFLLCFLALNTFSQESLPKSVEQLIEELKDDNRDISDAAIDELINRKDKSFVQLTSLAEQTTANSIIRARAISALSRIRDKKSVPVLIKLLNDEDSFVRGTSAYALSQIGGEKAKLALLAFLEQSLEKDHENLARATEAIKELPDARAFPTLMKIVKIGIEQKSALASRNTEKDIVKKNSLRYAVEALGQIGDPRASEFIAQLLDPTIAYVYSEDYFYLQAIYKTKSKEAAPYLLSYLENLVEKMKGQEKPEDELGSTNKQIIKNFQSFQQTVKCLEAISGQTSIDATREDVLIFWQQFWKSKD